MAEASLDRHDIPPNIRDSHPNLADLFDHTQGLRESLCAVWQVKNYLVWNLRRNEPDFVQSWIKEFERLIARVEATNKAFAPMVPAFVNAGINGSTFESLIELGETTLDLTNPHRECLDNPALTENCLNAIAKLLQSLNEAGTYAVVNGAQRRLRDEIILVASHHPQSNEVADPVTRTNLGYAAMELCPTAYTSPKAFQNWKWNYGARASYQLILDEIGERYSDVGWPNDYRELMESAGKGKKRYQVSKKE